MCGSEQARSHKVHGFGVLRQSAYHDQSLNVQELLMRRLLTGCLVTLLLLCNTLILFGPLMLFALLKLASSGRLRDYNSRR